MMLISSTHFAPHSGFLGELTLTGKRYSYPLGLTLANRFIASRVALIGTQRMVFTPLRAKA
jgi:2-polyprenyl-6-methoxyphenol hydroxylase-like FAD-dependent oxidoreductase